MSARVLSVLSHSSLPCFSCSGSFNGIERKERKEGKERKIRKECEGIRFQGSPRPDWPCLPAAIARVWLRMHQVLAGFYTSSDTIRRKSLQRSRDRHPRERGCV